MTLVFSLAGRWLQSVLSGQCPMSSSYPEGHLVPFRFS